MASLPTDVKLLQETVSRLSAELARAHGRPEGAASVTSAAEAWLLSSDQLPPLLSSYDARIAELERGESQAKERADGAEAEVRTLRQTSERLRAELQHALEAAVRTEALATHSALGKAKADPALRELQERLDVLYQENELLVEQQRETGAELERLREEKLAQARDHMSMVKQIAALREELGGGELRERRAAESRDRARSELQQCAAELMQAQEHTQSAMAIAERHAAERDAALASVAEHRSMLEQLNGRASADREALLSEVHVAKAAERDMREKAALVEAQLGQTSEREQALVGRLQAELQDKSAGAEALEALEGRCHAAEARVEALNSELGAAKASLSEAAAEQSHMASRVQAAETALARAEDRLSGIAAEEAARREALAASVRKDALAKRGAGGGGARDGGDGGRPAAPARQGPPRPRPRGARRGCRRGRRRRVGVVAARGGASARGGGGGPRRRRRVGAGDARDGRDGVAARGGRARARRRRDAAALLSMQLRAQNDALSAERNAASSRVEGSQRSLRRLEDEVGTLRQERAKLLGRVAELEQSLAACQSELSSIRHSSAEELRIASEASAAQVASLKRALADARALHEQSSGEVEALLKSQEELSSKYRDEAKTLASRSEALVMELRAECERLNIRNAEVTAQLAQAVSQNGKLEREEREAGQRAALLTKQLKEVQAVRAAGRPHRAAQGRPGLVGRRAEGLGCARCAARRPPRRRRRRARRWRSCARRRRRMAARGRRRRRRRWRPQRRSRRLAAARLSQMPTAA